MKPKGASFNIGDQGLFYNILDMGGAVATPDNKSVIITALTTIATAGGGILIVPHGVEHTFVAADFPVTTESLCIWEMYGDSFKLIPNKTHTTTLGAILASVRMVTPKLIGMELVDVLTDPPTYTFEWKVYDGVSGVAGSSFDVCFFVPGIATPVEAIARSGAVPGSHHFFKGIFVTGDSAFADDVTAASLTAAGTIAGSYLTGVKKLNKQIVVPVAAGSTVINDTTEALILNHAALIASHTITLPANPLDGQAVTIGSRSAITALTLNAGAGETIATGHGTTTLGASSHTRYIYDSATTSWYRLD